jgi:DNA invertase Pin-like site-specific DNA recombinase
VLTVNGFNALCRDATKRQFDVVMAWSVDRLGRSLQHLVGFLSELHALGIDLFLHQQGLDTTTPAGKAMFQMMGVFAEFERSIIRERVRSGLARAVAEGTKLGRPTYPANQGRRHTGCAGQAGPSWRAEDRQAVWRRSKHSSADQPPFRRRGGKSRIARKR